MSRNLAVATLTLLSLALLAATLVGHPLAQAVFAIGALAFPVPLIALGVARRDGSARLGAVLLALTLLLVGSGVGLLALSGGGTGGAPALLVLLLGLGVAPLVLVAIAYAVAFGRAGIDERDLRRIRRLAGGERPGTDGDAGG